jgi:dTDP-4-dehydrorhamnose 3,5-epimerase
MIVTPTSLPDVLLIQPEVYQDERGFFMETFQAERFAASGLPTQFVQDNQSGSCKGTLRGLHYQIRNAQGKLIRVIRGEIYDVAVDLRSQSPHFGKWVGTYLSAENKHQIWIPPGFAHGFYVLSDWAEVIYKTTDYYAPQWERTLIWNDPQIGIQWPIPEGTKPILSLKDSAGKRLAEAEVYLDMNPTPGSEQ